MRPTIKTIALLLTIAAVSTCISGAQARKTVADDKPTRGELTVSYSYLHSNAPPGGCTCINMAGGSATFAWPVKRAGILLVGDFAAGHAGGISSSGYTLTLSSYTVGARYVPKFALDSLHPFGQVLVGMAHSSGTLVQGPNTAVPNAGAAFAMNIGGGLNIPVSRRYSIRVIEADYLLTTFNNGSNNHQNNVRLGAGVTFHF